MAHNEFYVGELSAAEVAKRLASVAAEVAAGQHVQFTLHANVGGMVIPTVGVAGNDLPGAVRQFVESAGPLEFVLCQSASLKLPPVNGNSCNVTFARPKDDAPVIKLDGHIDATTAGPKLLASLGKHFNLLSRAAALGSALPKAEQELIRYRESVVADLEAAVGRIGRFQQEQIERQTRHIEQITVELQERHAAREKELDEQARKQREEIEAERKKLADERAQWDTQQRMAARRKLKGDLLEQLTKQEKMEVSEPTEKKRMVIHVACLAVLALAIALGVTGLVLIFRQQEPAARHFIPFSAAVLLFGSTLYFYLKWNNHWSSVFADAEVSVRRMKVDVLRANWVAELFLESKEATKIDLPPELVTQLAKNLFVDPAARDRELHPLDGILGSIRRAKSIQIAPNAIRIEQGKPGGDAGDQD